MHVGYINFTASCQFKIYLQWDAIPGKQVWVEVRGQPLKDVGQKHNTRMARWKKRVGIPEDHMRDSDRAERARIQAKQSSTGSESSRPEATVSLSAFMLLLIRSSKGQRVQDIAELKLHILFLFNILLGLLQQFYLSGFCCSAQSVSKPLQLFIKSLPLPGEQCQSHNNFEGFSGISAGGFD